MYHIDNGSKSDQLERSIENRVAILTTTTGVSIHRHFSVLFHHTLAIIHPPPLPCLSVCLLCARPGTIDHNIVVFVSQSPKTKPQSKAKPINQSIDRINRQL